MGKKKQKNFFPISTSVLAILLGLLLLLATAESYMRGEVHLLLVFLGIINGLCGLVGGILFLAHLEQGRILIKWQSFLGIIFTLFYAVVNNEWRNPTILLFILFSLIFILSRLSVVWQYSKNYLPRKNRRIHMDWKLKLLLSLTIIFLGLTWAFEWEKYLGIFHTPSGEGLSFYFNKTESPKIQVSVDGGYIYDFFEERGGSLIQEQVEGLDSREGVDGEIVFVANSPQLEINIEGYVDEVIRLRFINLLKDVTFEIDDKEDSLNWSESFSRWEDDAVTSEEVISSVQSSVYLLADRGYWKDIEIEKGKEYVVRINETDRDSEGFLTKENKKEVEKVRFLVLSDLHSGYKTFVPELKSIDKKETDFLVWNGDIVNWGYPTEYMIMSSISQSYPIPVYTTIGNHDIWNDGRKLYRRYFGPEYYSFVYKESTFIFLDTSEGVLGSAQIEWLENELEGKEDQRIFVFSHMSPIDTVLGSYDTSQLIDPELSRTMYSKAESDYLLEVMDLYNVDSFFSGHSHIMGSTLLNGTLYISSGALGGTVSGEHQVGYLDCVIMEKDFDCENVVVKSNEELQDTTTKNYLNALNVFGIPFFINKSFRIFVTLILLIIINISLFGLFGKAREGKK